MSLIFRFCQRFVAPRRPGTIRTRRVRGGAVAWRRPALEELEQRLVLSVPTPDHVVIVTESSRAYGDIIGNSNAPYINSLAQAGASFTNAHGISSVGEPNYLGLFSGSTQGVTDDGSYTFSGANLRSN